VIVSDLIEKLQAMPGHLPVTIEMDDSIEGMPGVAYCLMLDVEIGAFSTFGRMAVITINLEPQ